MSEASKAVFLSYASQDAAAALRICDALRAAGVEVWFDQSELVGGDAWDAKIRKQIAECALFVPVISANTQARLEGYFRLEWKIAAQRTHTMADERVFLLPVVIDETRDADAKVPAEFKGVQWTRLPGGGQAERFCARLQDLLHQPSAAKANDGVAPAAGLDPAARGSAPVRPMASKSSRRLLVVGGAALAGAAAFAFWWRGEVARPPAVFAAVTTADAPPKGKAAPLSPARELVEKARVLYEPWDLATKDDLVMAEQFLKRAAELDPTDGEVWAHQSLLLCAFVGMSVTEEDRRVEMRTQAERAVKLAPNSDLARFARAYAIRLAGGPSGGPEAEPILRDLVARNPQNKAMLRALGVSLADRVETRAEGRALLQRAAALPGGDAVAEHNLGQTFMNSGPSGDLRQALAAINRSLKLAPAGHRTHSLKIELYLRFAGDLAAARQALREVPLTALREDRVVAIAVRVLLANGEPDEALRLLGSTHTYLNATFFQGPAAYLKGLALHQAGRASAAATEWNIALKELQRRLDANPASRTVLGLKAATLAQLGRTAEAAETLQLYEQVIGPRRVGDGLHQRTLVVKTLLGQIPEVVASLEEALRTRDTQTAAFVLFSPELALLRTHPGYAALAEKARAIYAEVQLK